MKRKSTLVGRLDKKIDTPLEHLMVAILKTQHNLAEIKRTMATKSDIDRILNLMADFAKETHIVLQNQEFYCGYIHDHEARLIWFEKHAAS